MRLIFLTLIIMLLAFGGVRAQSELPFKFTANEKADVHLMEKWDFQYQPLKTELDVSFTGDSLLMVWKSKKVFWKTAVKSFERKEKTDYDKLTGLLYILAIEKDGFIQYTIIEKRLVYEHWIFDIKIPYYDKNKEFSAYSYYQQF